MSCDTTHSPSDAFSRSLPVSLVRTPEHPEKLIRIMAGTVTLSGLALGFWVSPWGYLLTAFAGANVLQSAFTGFCPPEITYRWLRKTSALKSAAADKPGSANKSGLAKPPGNGSPRR